MTTRTLIVHSNELKTAEKVALMINGEIEIKNNHFRIHSITNFEIENLRLNG